MVSVCHNRTLAQSFEMHTDLESSNFDLQSERAGITSQKQTLDWTILHFAGLPVKSDPKSELILN